ncbi:MAG TPA: hypothetical protein VJO16_10730 [Candidatus Acidoferrum sp.]|nr:hypothetical protein [Candidatus Acidoferrum sp.]
MTRLRVYFLTVTGNTKRLAVTRPKDCTSITKIILALLASVSLLTTPVWAAPSSSLGVVVYADRAHVGAAQASVGATIFNGDRLTTEQTGSMQVRTGAARLLLASGSIATLSEDSATPAATLTLGTVTFSTANSNAFALHVASAVIRAKTNQPTIGRVTVLTPKELIVRSTRGSLTIAVDDDVREIPEGTAYRVVLDPSAQPPQGPQGAGTKGYGGPPIKAAKSKFIWYAIGITAVVTYFAVSESLESPDRP